MDNRYFNYNCPSLMNDGRFITNYVRSSTFDQYIRQTNNIESSHEYRHYLQENGHQIMNNIKAYLHENNTCSVQGQCVPISTTVKPVLPKCDYKNIWFDDLLDEEPPQLNFMMQQNNVNNTVHESVCTQN